VRVRDHIVFSAVGAVLLAPWAGRGAAGFLAGGVLIDADHYVWFCVRHQRLDPRAAVRYFNQAHPPQPPASRALHQPQALAAALLLGARQRSLLPLALGMCLHVALDGRHEARMSRARAEALRRDESSCRACGTQGPRIETHLTHQPVLLPSYRTRDLISLCGPCHEVAHARGRGPDSWT
jgi:hypothetical protein